MITVVAIFIVLMQVNIVQAGTAIKYAIVDDKAFKVQNTKGFTGIDWNAINRNIYAGFSCAMRQYQSALVLDAAAPMRPRCARCQSTSTRTSSSGRCLLASYNAFRMPLPPSSCSRYRATMQMRCFALAIFPATSPGSRRERKRNRHHQLIEKSWVVGQGVVDVYYA